MVPNGGGPTLRGFDSRRLHWFTPAGMALRETFSGLLTQPELNRTLAEQICAFDVAYPEAPLPAPAGLEVAPELSGRRLPDQPVKDASGTPRSLYSLLHEGRWLLLQRPSARHEVAAPWPGWTTRVKAEPAREDTGAGTWSSLLVRPDGHVGYVAA